MMKKRAANDILLKITSDDILMEILSCLPVKSLLRFRCVSKTWLSLISSPHFVKLQLNRSIQVNPKILFSTAYEDTYTIDYQTQCYDPEALDFPVNDQLIRGSCNGLLCLSDGENYMALWNPATKEDVAIPYASVEYDILEEVEEGEVVEIPYASVVVGFGFDSVMEQYKIVRSIFFFRDFERSKFYQSEVKVCTLGTGEWRRLEDPPCRLRDRHMAPLVSGALHWLGGSPIGSNTLEHKVVSFDICSEEFRVVPWIECMSDTEYDVTIGVLQGCLSALVSDADGSWIIHIWMMKDYGVKESWTKLFSVQMPSKDIQFTCSIEPLVLCENGEMIVKSGGELYIYNNGIDHTLAATYNIYCDHSSCYAGHVYAESLVSIESLVHPETDKEAP